MLIFRERITADDVLGVVSIVGSVFVTLRR